MNSDLIERLEYMLSYHNELMDNEQALIKEAIEALSSVLDDFKCKECGNMLPSAECPYCDERYEQSPVLPDEVDKILNNKIEGGSLYVPKQARDLIERLARDCWLREDEILHRENIAREQQQRIEELKKELRTAKAQRNTAYGYGQDGGEPPWMK